MGATEFGEHIACRCCRRSDPSVRDRGWVRIRPALCDSCWHAYGQRLATEEGALAEPRPEPHPDDPSWYEPLACQECSATLAHYRTDYDHWVLLGLRDRPPANVPPGHRWRLVTAPERGAPSTAEVIAVRVERDDPLPALVRPTHRAICPATEAEGEGG